MTFKNHSPCPRQIRIKRMEIWNIHEPTELVDILDDDDVMRIEQKLFAIFGPDADISDLVMIIETSSGRNRPKRVRCHYRDQNTFWVNLLG